MGTHEKRLCKALLGGTQNIHLYEKVRKQLIEDIQMFGVNMTFISSSEVKKCTFHECRRHE